jgi:hypothetical protein
VANSDTNAELLASSTRLNLIGMGIPNIVEWNTRVHPRDCGRRRDQDRRCQAMGGARAWKMRGGDAAGVRSMPMAMRTGLAASGIGSDGADAATEEAASWISEQTAQKSSVVLWRCFCGFAGCASGNALTSASAVASTAALMAAMFDREPIVGA